MLACFLQELTFVFIKVKSFPDALEINDNKHGGFREYTLLTPWIWRLQSLGSYDPSTDSANFQKVPSSFNQCLSHVDFCFVGTSPVSLSFKRYDIFHPCIIQVSVLFLKNP